MYDSRHESKRRVEETRFSLYVLENQTVVNNRWILQGLYGFNRNCMTMIYVYLHYTILSFYYHNYTKIFFKEFEYVHHSMNLSTSVGYF